MNDQSCSSLFQERCSTFTQGYPWDLNVYLRFAVVRYGEITEIAGMPSLGDKSMLVVFRIEVSSRGCEIRWIALSGHVDVESMLAGGQIFDTSGEMDAARTGRNANLAYDLALGILQLGSGSRGQTCGHDSGYNKRGKLHALRIRHRRPETQAA